MRGVRCTAKGSFREHSVSCLPGNEASPMCCTNEAPCFTLGKAKTTAETKSTLGNTEAVNPKSQFTSAQWRSGVCWPWILSCTQTQSTYKCVMTYVCVEKEAEEYMNTGENSILLFNGRNSYMVKPNYSPFPVNSSRIIRYVFCMIKHYYFKC